VEHTPGDAGNAVSVSSVFLLLKFMQTNYLKKRKGESMSETISGLLSMVKVLSQRKAQLETEIVKINNALFQIDKKIKESNAKTQIELDIQFDELMSEL
jgi:septal ring factor EnvC (AmiA/AmiB activator)